MFTFIARALSDIQYKRDARKAEREGYEYTSPPAYEPSGYQDDYPEYHEEEANPHLLRIEYKPEEAL